MNDQRKVIYEQRKELMTATDVTEDLADMRRQVIENMVARCIPEKAYAEQWNVQALHEEALRVLRLDLPIGEWAKEEGIADAGILDRLAKACEQALAEKDAKYGQETMRALEKSLLLQLLDQVWKDHLLTLDHLRQGIGLRAYGQKDPLNEYKREAFTLFGAMLDSLRERITQVMSHIEIQYAPGADIMPSHPRQETIESRKDPALRLGGEESTESLDFGRDFSSTVHSRQASESFDPHVPSTWGRVSRNQSCPCGSGKKYKHCHGSAA